MVTSSNFCARFPGNDQMRLHKLRFSITRLLEVRKSIRLQKSRKSLNGFLLRS